MAPVVRERPAPRTMTIPEVRERLYEMGSQWHSEELLRLADQLWRRPYVRSTRRTQRRPSPEQAEAIRIYAAEHPDLSEWQIGVDFGVNQGRISEVLAGFREDGPAA